MHMQLIDIFKTKYLLKVKGDGILTYHLGTDYFEDPDDIFVSQPKKHINKLAETLTFKRLSMKVHLKHTKLLLTRMITQNEILLIFLKRSQLQWLVTLGRLDIHAHVATMVRFRAAPRQGHMDRLKRIHRYAIRTKDYAVRLRTDQPDYSFVPEQDFDWTYTVYGDVQEIFPDDMPEPIGEAVVTTTTMDVNLKHCLATGNS